MDDPGRHELEARLQRQVVDNQRLRTHLATLIRTFDALRASTAWRLAERLMRLVMTQGRLGRGETGLDNLYGQLADLRRASGLPRAPGQSFRVGLVVTDDPPDTAAGDVFTATELAAALERELGWECTYLARHSSKRNWYDTYGLDAIIVLLHDYDLSQVQDAAPGLLRIAWLRNWFDAWVAQPWFGDYDLALCSSERARDWVAARSAVRTATLRIASNPERFRPGIEVRDELRSDCCFTGSWWQNHREIEDFEPATLGHHFALFGANWGGHERFAKHWRGALPYADMPQVYAGTKLLIDDANHVTKPWGSVNSRVFDALASGTLVITNGRLGAEEVFDGLLPTWDDAAALGDQVRRLLDDDSGRQDLARRLRQLVLEQHTYAHRARELAAILATVT